MTAKRRPSITFVANKAGTFIRASGARCWTKQSVDYNFVGSPPFGFFPKEYMSVGARHGNRVELIGKMSAFRGFKETDTLNATTHQMIGESIFFGRDHRATEQHLITSYHTTRTAPQIPQTNPVC